MLVYCINHQQLRSCRVSTYPILGDYDGSFVRGVLWNKTTNRVVLLNKPKPGEDVAGVPFGRSTSVPIVVLWDEGLFNLRWGIENSIAGIRKVTVIPKNVLNALCFKGRWDEHSFEKAFEPAK